MACKWLGELELRDLPNEHGYAFIGVRWDGTHCECHVTCGDDGLHVIDGAATYWELRGWKPKAEATA